MEGGPEEETSFAGNFFYWKIRILLNFRLRNRDNENNLTENSHLSDEYIVTDCNDCLLEQDALEEENSSCGNILERMERLNGVNLNHLDLSTVCF